MTLVVAALLFGFARRIISRRLISASRGQTGGAVQPTLRNLHHFGDLPHSAAGFPEAARETPLAEKPPVFCPQSDARRRNPGNLALAQSTGEKSCSS
ncbi:MAG: hypothetical protein Q4G14_14015 [Paracoccus sp. (in: a-proteobacteria)]|uniref:hypothetical protein n=1 Tax=Paracoccus sp. TaxID=267 RepID=UPI0026E08AAF|nr:hypothetical protein [Paracoccus sp. (in: a-proteobacteria)]MDO5614342.1 hypothetical protein [Paracoccus sp. (in: a-proteobacteria)]